MYPAMSGDGRFVSFTTYSPLAPPDTNRVADVFVRDRRAGETSKASLRTDGGEVPHGSGWSVISDDGRYVAFESMAYLLLPSDPDWIDHIYLRDRVARTVSRVSVSSAGVRANAWSRDPAISADGRYVAFASDATNLVVGDTNDRRDVFVHDRVTRTTTRVSVSSSGVQGDEESVQPSISGDGRYVAFLSFARLVPGYDNDWCIFVHDRVERTTVRLAQGDHPAISRDGRWVAYRVGGPKHRIMVADRITGRAFDVSVPVSGGTPDGECWDPPAISADGHTIAFESEATNLVAGDTNDRADIFVREWWLEPPGMTVAGPDRYATAVEASKVGYPSGAASVVIATGENWPDALGGSALAGAVDGPLLLTRATTIPDVTRAEIVRLKAKTAYVLGGAARSRTWLSHNSRRFSGRRTSSSSKAPPATRPPRRSRPR
jgi:Tol biopolymer transport system component